MSKMMNLLAGIAFTAVAITPAISTAADDDVVEGVVREVRTNGDLTIKHGPIKSLDMSPMTMVFKMSDPKLSKGVKVGDNVKFHVEDVGGKLTITKIEKAK